MMTYLLRAASFAAAVMVSFIHFDANTSTASGGRPICDKAINGFANCESSAGPGLLGYNCTAITGASELIAGTGFIESNIYDCTMQAEVFNGMYTGANCVGPTVITYSDDCD